MRPPYLAPPAMRSPLADAALAALLLALLSGVALSFGFDVTDADRSISRWLIFEPAARLARNLHYGSAHAFLLLALACAFTGRRAPNDAEGGRRGALALALLLAGLLAAQLWGGFMLRGDGDARELWRQLVLLLRAQPMLGGWAESLPRVAEPATQRLYYAHVAGGLVLALAGWRLLAWQRRPSLLAYALTVASIALAALWLTPGLHDGADPIVRGPWNAAGLAWLAESGRGEYLLTVLLLALVAGAALVWRGCQRALRRGLAVVAGSYLLLSLVAAVLLDSDGPWRPHPPRARADVRVGFALTQPKLPAPAAADARGRLEGCVACHGRMTGIEAAHETHTVGCAACHSGDPFTLDARRAHAGMVSVPGNLADARRSCGQADCHVAMPARVQTSLMATMAGVIAVDREVIGLARGEPADAHAGPAHPDMLGMSAADHHLRELCTSCHLGQPKEDWGPITQESRGGGCNACHLVYDAPARAALERYLATSGDPVRKPPAVHPRLTANPDDEHCFGCHSRSGRISLAYAGWAELRTAPPADVQARQPARYRQLVDGRMLQRQLPDVHHERGLACIDCHTSLEVMGSGVPHRRKFEALRVGCADCHAARMATIAPDALDAESRTLLRLRGLQLEPGQRLGATRRGDPLVNVVVEADGRASLRRKHHGDRRTLKPPAAVCTEGGGHARLTCESCHSAWAPRCTSCHTQFDPNEESFDNLTRRWGHGSWMESSGPFEAAPATLGVLPRHDSGQVRAMIDNFVPGMVMTFDRNRDPAQPPDTVFRRLYAPAFAHTIRREARRCESCHLDPVALGYGRGELRLERRAEGARWRFAPREPALADGLPADAWIGFLQTRESGASTRADARPFSAEEQRRVLRAGACLTCHRGDSRVMREAVRDMAGTLARRRPQCVAPD